MDEVLVGTYAAGLLAVAGVAALDSRLERGHWPWRYPWAAALRDGHDRTTDWVVDSYRTLRDEDWTDWLVRCLAAWLAVGQILRAGCHLTAATLGGVSPALVEDRLPTRSPVAAATGWTEWSGRSFSLALGCALLDVVLSYRFPASAVGLAAQATLFAQVVWLLADPLFGGIERLTTPTATTDHATHER
jgi:hypothetical protein